MERYPASGIDLLIAGGGIAGVVTALEATRNGQKATVLESRPTNDPHGSQDEPQSSWHSCFRAAMPTSHAFANPVVKRKIGPANNDGKDSFWFFLGPDSHAVVAAGKEITCWALLRKDAGRAADESWNNYIGADEALNLVNDKANWDPGFLALAHQTEKVNDYRLTWRNPQSKTISDGGHVIQIGDAAHALLPTSANGACQAMEDACSLPACLRLAGKDRISLGLHIHSEPRFERVACAQKMGLMTREKLHKTDWESVEKDPSVVETYSPGAWIATHDPEVYAIEKFEARASHIEKGTPFANTNKPEGYTYEPWDFTQLMKDSDEGKRIMDQGNWD